MAKRMMTVMVSATVTVEIEDSIHADVDDDAEGADLTDEDARENILKRRAESAGRVICDEANFDTYDVNAL